MPGEIVSGVLKHVWMTLEPLGHPMALMGGMSLAAWNRIRATQDVDLLIGLGRDAVSPLIDRLGRSGCHPKKDPPLTVVGDHCFLQFLYTPPDEFFDVQFDLLLAETPLQQSAIDRRVRRAVVGVSQSMDVLNCDDLILFKLLAGRLIDRADASALLRENRDQIDFDYLRRWVAELMLEAELAEAWNDAFPGGSDAST